MFRQPIAIGALVKKNMYTNLRDVYLYGIVLGHIFAEPYEADWRVSVYWFKTVGPAIRKVPYTQSEFVSMLHSVGLE